MPKAYLTVIREMEIFARRKKFLLDITLTKKVRGVLLAYPGHASFAYSVSAINII